MTHTAVSSDFESAKAPFFRKGSFSQQLKENPTGAGYFACNILWMIAGYMTTGVDVAAGFSNFIGSSSRLTINPEYEFMGKQNWDRRMGASMGAVSTAISTLPKAVASFLIGDYVTLGAIVLNDALISGAQYVDFKSGELQGLDRSKYSEFIGKILENPSYYAGLGRAASRLLPIGLSLASGNLPVALAFVALGVVDLYYTRTKAVTEHKSVNAATKQPTAEKLFRLPLLAGSRINYAQLNRPVDMVQRGKRSRPLPRFEGMPTRNYGTGAYSVPTYDKTTRRMKYAHG